MDIIVNVSQVAIIVLLSENFLWMASKKFKKGPHLSTLESMKYECLQLTYTDHFPWQVYQLCDISLTLSNQQPWNLSVKYQWHLLFLMNLWGYWAILLI